MLDMTEELNVERYKNLGKNLYQFMLKHGYTSNPAPKVILNNSEQESDVLCYTGYFDPNRDAIILFTRGRLVKDVLRTLAHELIHYKQRVDGIIDKSGYTSDKITEDKNLVKLEAEAYLKGNFAFREWTETLQKKLSNKNQKQQLNESAASDYFESLPDVRTLGDGNYDGELAGCNFTYNGKHYKSPIGIRCSFPVKTTLQITGNEVKRL